MSSKFRSLLLLFFWCAVTLSAQQDTVWIQADDSHPLLRETQVIKPRVEIPDYLSDKVDQLIADGHLEANLDKLVSDSTGAYRVATLHLGPRYDFSQLQLDSASLELLSLLSLKAPKDTEDFLSVRAALRDYLGDIGYPFASVKLDSLHLNEGIVTGELGVELGDQVIMDSLVIKGNLKLRENYLRNYLDLERGSPYHHTRMLAIRRKLDRLTFANVTQDAELSFIGSYATLNLFLDAKNTSRFDVIFGVVPTTAAAGQRLILSIDFTAELLNKLGYGEYILLDFERLRPEQQKLDLRFNYPYLLDTPFAIDTRFSIFRNSLDYQTVLADLGLQYFISSEDKVKVSYYSEASRVVEVDSMTILAGNLPEDLSVSQVGLGIGLELSRLDYKFNPRKGFSLEAKAVIGQRRILEDAVLSEFKIASPEFAQKFDALERKTPRYEMTLDAAYFIPVGRLSTIGFMMQAGAKLSSAELLRNEQFQIGGHQLLRGFDEATIFTPFYGLMSAEFRLALGKNSYFQAPFLDVGWISEEGVAAFVAGVGGGLVFETKVGLFNFSVAAGKPVDQGFDFGRPRAHFGYISLF